MQQTGTLKKRRKRNLAKVAGLGTIPYDENADNFDGRSLFTTNLPLPGQHSIPLSIRSGAETTLRMNSSELRQARFDSGRVTRDPKFSEYEEENEIDDIAYDSVAAIKPRPPLPDYIIKYRSHFLDKWTMVRLKQLLILGAACGGVPWIWNKKKTRVETWSEAKVKAWWIFWFFYTVQTSCLTLYQFYAFYHQFSNEDGQQKTYREIFMSSFSVCWYCWAVYFLVNLYYYKEPIRQYINTMLYFNKKYVDKYLIHLDNYKDGGRLIINLAILTNCSQILASLLLFLVMPYQPWFLFHYIYPKPWYWIIPGAIQEFIMVGQVVFSYMFMSWVVVAHVNTVEFWLRETHNHNDSDYTTDELRNPKLALETYRALQILCTVFNDCMAPMAVPMVKILILSALIPCSYVMIRSMNHIFIDEFPGILTYPIGVIDTVTAGFVILSMAAEMFDLACSFIDSWSRTKQKDFRRILMSCPCLKVKVGRWYFVTVSTTITFFKHAPSLLWSRIVTVTFTHFTFLHSSISLRQEHFFYWGTLGHNKLETNVIKKNLIRIRSVVYRFRSNNTISLLSLELTAQNKFK